MEPRTYPRSVWTQWQWSCLLALSLVIASFVTAASLSHVARAAGLLRDWPIGGQIDTGTREDAKLGWQKVTQILPGGAGARAGLRPGDLVRSEIIGVSMRAVLAPGAHLPLIVDRAGTRFRTQYIYPKQAFIVRGEIFVFVAQGVAGLLSAGLGVLILLLRGRRSRAAAMLGMVLQCLAWNTGGFGFVVAPSPFAYQLARILSALAFAGMAYFLPIASFEIAGGRRSPGEGRLLHIAAGFLAIVAGSFILTANFLMILRPWIGVAILVSVSLLCVGSISRSYRRNDAPSRNRIKIVLVAFAGYVVSFVLFAAWTALGQSVALVWMPIASAVIGLCGPALITYAMLRQRLFDINFALNRTLVYGVVSFILLAAFGLAEWGAERLVPEAWHRNGQLISAGIALALFLSFHRIRDWVERHVERLLFSSWHENEAALRRFVAAAGHFDTTASLCQAFAKEFGRFAQGAGVALHLGQPGSSYRLAAGKLAGARKDLTADDRAFALMRAERGPVHLAQAHSELAGLLALPMLDQGKLTGFVLLARKPDGTEYRPDEVEVLGWATQQVGFALQTRRVHELEASNALLIGKVGELSALLAAASKPRSRSSKRMMPA